MDYLIRWFFLRLTNTLKQSALLHFITSGLKQFIEKFHEMDRSKSYI